MLTATEKRTDNSKWSVLLTTLKDGQEIRRFFYTEQEPGEYENTCMDLVPPGERHVFALILSLDWHPEGDE